MMRHQLAGEGYGQNIDAVGIAVSSLALRS